MTSDGQRQGENVRWVGISLGIVVSLRFLELTAVHSREMGQGRRGIQVACPALRVGVLFLSINRFDGLEND